MKNISKNGVAILLAVLAATLYALNVPLSKLFLAEVGTTMLAGLLYLGAGIGIGMLFLAKRLCKVEMNCQWLDKKDLPFTVAMVLLDIVAPILLMLGIASTSSGNVALLNNFEIVATSVIALVIFKEKISGRLWFAIILVAVASGILSFQGRGAFAFNKGSLLVLGACLCLGYRKQLYKEHKPQKLRGNSHN